MRTAFAPAVRVIVITMLPADRPVQVHADWNDEIVCVFSTAPVPASLICTVSARPLLSQSSKYSSRSCACPSPRLTSTVKLVGEYQTAATRLDEPGTCKARGSVEVVVQV